MTLELCNHPDCPYPKHYRNCPNCIGWGLAQKDKAVRIVTGPETVSQSKSVKYMPCKICGGNLKGVINESKGSK